MATGSNPRYVIIGAGAIGGGLGGLLTEAGVDVVLVARGDHLEAMRAGGLNIRTPERATTVQPQVAGGPGEVDLRPNDVLVLTTKTQQAEAALSLWADAPVRDAHGTELGRAGDLLPVLTATNGVSSERMALRWFRRVIGTCVWMPAVFLSPGEVVVRMAPQHGVFHVGRVPAAHSDDADRALTDAVVADWARGGFSVHVQDDVMAWKYRKLLSNIGNAFQALAGAAEGLGGVDGVADLRDAAESEAEQVLAAAGRTVADERTEEAAREGFRVGPVPGLSAAGGSTWQSLSRGRPDNEADFLNGEIVAIANAYGLPAPRNATVAALMRRATREGWRPGHFDEDELRRLLTP